MKATGTLNTNVIENATVILAGWPDDLPGYYAVDAANADSLAAAFRDLGASAELIGDDEALAVAAKGAWIGIKVASTGHVAAWGHAKLTQ